MDLKIEDKKIDQAMSNEFENLKRLKKKMVSGSNKK